MQDFDYVSAKTLKEAVSLLNKHGDQACVLSGGTDLIVQLREGRRKARLVVDVKDIPQLNQMSYTKTKGLTLGAAVPCCRVYEDKAIAQAYPGLIDAASLIGGVQIQGRATVGGNLCNASPAADTIPALIALGAVCTVTGPKGTRKVRVEDFCTAPGRTALKKGELLVSLHLPPPKPRSGAFFLRFIPRNEMDIAVVNAGASVVLDAKKKTFVSARIALGAVAPTPLFVTGAGEALAGKPVSDESIEAAAEIAKAAARPISDMRGTAEQRRHLSGVLTRRALQGAIERAKGGK
ncbi:MAG: xanthine dehydrogenase family protein subunit M [Candidatus Latescibacteria bacterium]|nr:xanthine dehydrogenase family protein subunit M [Candidatus Latescibacterota bacterium]